MKGSVLIRLMSKSGDIQRVEVSDSTAIEAIGLPELLLEEIKRFWSSDAEVLYLKQAGGLADYKVVVERVSERRALLVFGAGHVGRSVALMGVMLGLDVSLIDDRGDFLSDDTMPVCSIRRLLVDFGSLDNSLLVDQKTAIVIVTRGHQYDEVILKQIASREAGYVGMIGSKRRVESIFRRLRGEGVSESFLRSVKAPIGLELGAISPQEIAIAIHAEIIKHFNSTSSRICV